MQTSTGITTRSKARVAPDQWTKIPLPAKVIVDIQEGSTDVTCRCPFILKRKTVGEIPTVGILSKSSSSSSS